MLNHLKSSKLGKTALAAMAALTLYSSPAKADDNLEAAIQQEDFDQEIEPLDIVVESILAYGIKVFWHELGHYSVAVALGSEASIHGPSIDKPAVAYTLIANNSGMSHGERILLSSAGIGLTTLSNIGLTNYLVNSDNDNSLRPFLGALSFAMMIDRYTYVTNSALTHFTGIENSNSNDIDSLIGHIGIDPDLGYAAFLAGTIAEATMRWQEIAYLYQTAIGNSPKYKPSGIIFSFVPGEDSVSFQLTSRF